MSQFDDVSNIANPTFDAELAIRITVNAQLPNTPQRNAPPAGASDLAVDSLDNTIPVGGARSGQPMAPESKIKWRTTRTVSRRRSAKTRYAAAEKVRAVQSLWI